LLIFVKICWLLVIGYWLLVIGIVSYFLSMEEVLL
tara:strand:- start:689 stop:793 length:105 start_codon:yes stop_codon:yes gene_type:complete